MRGSGIKPAVVDSLGGVLDLENAAIRREGGNRQIVTCAYAAHCRLVSVAPTPLVQITPTTQNRRGLVTIHHGRGVMFHEKKILLQKYIRIQ